MVGNFQWPQGIMKCNFCEFRLTTGGNTNLCWFDQRYILRDLKLQPELCHANWRVYVFTCAFNSRPQKWIFKELRLQNYVGLPSLRKSSPQVERLGHSWGVCLPSGSSEQQEGGSDCSMVSWFVVGTGLGEVRAFVVASISLQVKPRSNEAWGVKLIFKQTMWPFFHLQWLYDNAEKTTVAEKGPKWGANCSSSRNTSTLWQMRCWS